jgi:hypothetical protein
MKKKTFAALLTAALCLGLLSGCGGGGEAPVTPASSNTPSKEAKQSEEELFLERIAEPWAYLNVRIGAGADQEPIYVEESAQMMVQAGQVLAFELLPRDDIAQAYDEILQTYTVQLETESDNATVAHIGEQRIIFGQSGAANVTVCYSVAGQTHEITLQCAVEEAQTGSEMANFPAGGTTLLTDDGTLLITGVGHLSSSNDCLYYGTPDEYFLDDNYRPYRPDTILGLGADSILSTTWSLSGLSSLNDEIYYITSGEIRKMTPDWQSYTTIYASKAAYSTSTLSYFFILNGELYCYEDSGALMDDHFLCLSPNGEVLRSSPPLKRMSQVLYHGGMLYFQGITEDGTQGAFRMDLLLENIEPVSDGMIPFEGRFYLHDGKTYTLTSANRLIANDWGSDQPQVIATNVAHIIFYQEKLYFLTLPDHYGYVELYAYESVTGEAVELFRYRQGSRDLDISVLAAQGGRLYFLCRQKDGVNQGLPVYDIATGQAAAWLA